MLNIFVSPFALLNQLTSFHKNWYELLSHWRP